MERLAAFFSRATRTIIGPCWWHSKGLPTSRFPSARRTVASYPWASLPPWRKNLAPSDIGRGLISVSNHDLERYHLGIVKDEAELPPLKSTCCGAPLVWTVRRNPLTTWT